ncbi:helix-turn-helix domain-containing protein [Streptomyces sp. NPDC054834]
MKAADGEYYRAVLRRTAGLSPSQRLIVLLYAMMPTDRAGAVRMTGQELAAEVDMTPTVFSRMRRQLVEAGWLEQSDRFSNIVYFRLTSRATGEENVVSMRRVM